MIIQGGRAGNVGFWSSHLLRQDTNERAEIKEIRGAVATDLQGALREMQAVASASRCDANFMYQANINPLANESLTPQQWQTAIDTLERDLGFEGHARIVVEHVKGGRQHQHVIWSRVDSELRTVSPWNNFDTHERTARQLEREFDLEPTPQNGRAAKTLALWEVQRGEKTKIDPHAVKAEVSELWQQADCGQAFATALEERGYMLARGDRRDFCIIDHAGTVHSLARRLDGVKPAEVRERMADVDRQSLPAVAEARAQQHERHRDPAEAWATREPEEVRERAGPRALDAGDAGMGTPPGAAVEEAERAPKRDALDAVADGGLNMIGKFAEAVGDLFGGSEPPLTPQQHERLAQRESDAAEARHTQQLETRQAKALERANTDQAAKADEKSTKDEELAQWIMARGRERGRSDEGGRER